MSRSVPGTSPEPGAGADVPEDAGTAEAVVAENNTPAVVGILSALGILLISVVMLKGVLPRALAWLGIATGGLGVIAEVLRHAVPEFYLGYGLLLWVWFVAVGIALVRLARRTPRSGAGATPAIRPVCRIAMPSVSRPAGTVCSVSDMVAMSVGAIEQPPTSRARNISGGS